MAVEAAGFPQPPDQIARMSGLRRGLRKARKIRRVLECALGPVPWRDATLLDVGCGPGVIARGFARYCRHVVAVDIDAPVINAARARFGRENLTFLAPASRTLPVVDGWADVVICNHVYEHAADPAALFSEIHRVLSDRGVAYVAAAGKYQLLEPHYGLPFLSWLPAPWADAYLRLTGRPGGYRVYLLPYRRLLRLLSSFTITEYTAAILKDPRRFGADEALGRWRPLARGLAWVARRFPALAPTRVFILTAARD